MILCHGHLFIKYSSFFNFGPSFQKWVSVFLKNTSIRVNHIDFKLVQFADDTTIILDGSENSLIETLNELENFAKSKLSKNTTHMDREKKYSTETIKTRWKLQRGSS